MATPNENVLTLRAYWKAANAVRLPGGRNDMLMGAADLIQPLANAMRAMKELVKAAAMNPHVRAQVFAASSVFEQALVGEGTDTTTKVFAAARGGVAAAILQVADADQRPPRQIMLDEIWNAGVGGLFSPSDRSGVTSWLHSASVSAGAINGAIAGDPNPGVVAAALRIFRDLALPVIWLESASSFRMFEQLDSRLATTVWSHSQVADLASRLTLKALSASAAGRVGTDLAMLASLAVQSFLTGNGMNVPTVPPKRKPWYRHPGVISAGIVGIVGGAVMRAR